MKKMRISILRFIGLLLGILAFLYVGLSIYSSTQVIRFTSSMHASLESFTEHPRKPESLTTPQTRIAKIGIGNPLVEIRNEIRTTMKDEYKRRKTLALLYPKGVLGGYRNQVLRFIAFVSHAQKNKIPQMLLPSMLWATKHKIAPPGSGLYPIPMELLFDIDHWNSFSDHLPILVSELDNSDCWQPNPTEKIQRSQPFDPSKILSKSKDSTNKMSLSNATNGLATPEYWVSPLAPTVLERAAFLTPIANLSRSIIQGHAIMERQTKDYLPEVEHCTHPIVFGGGKGAGRLWNSYQRLTRPLRIVKKSPSHEELAKLNETSQFLRLVSNALRPALYWRKLADQCVTHYQQQQQSQAVQQHISTTESAKKATKPSNFVVLHTRVEVDMMIHRCGDDMEMNLTKIFQMVDSFVTEHNENQSLQKNKLNGVLLAVSRHGIINPVNKYTLGVQPAAKENWRTFISRIADGNINGTNESGHDVVGNVKSSAPTRQYFECGEHWMDQWYNNITKQDRDGSLSTSDFDELSIEYDHFGSTVPSMMNFYIATQASVFIGVAKSSWSVEVWTTRYYQGKGSANYEYTKNGIVPIPNGGLPPLYKQC